MRDVIALRCLLGLGMVLPPNGAVTVSANSNGCRMATNEFELAKGNLKTSLGRYAACVTKSDGNDDCATEFSDVLSDKDDFETAVAVYASECSGS